MYKKIASLVFVFVCCCQLRATEFPLEGAVLNYRLIGFSFTKEPLVVNYNIQIAAGRYYTEDSFARSIVKTLSTGENKIVAEVPSFGAEYTWRVNWTNKNGVNGKSKFHHFSTGFEPEVDERINRVRVLKPAQKYKDAYIFLDGTGVLYDMNGKPVWFLSNKEISGTPATLQLSPKSTITFLNNEQAYEVNYQSEILWQGPKNGVVSGDNSEHYHHEFMRLANGHYMVMGSERVEWKSEGVGNGDAETNESAIGAVMQKGNRKILFSTIIEYDEKGTVVWSWKASSYFQNSDLKYYTPPPPLRIVDVHENAFYFDEHDKIIYISCKNINRVLKVKYPEGIVLNSYGEKYRPGILEAGNGLFCGQHSCGRTMDKDLYLYNNNACNKSRPIPKILIIKETEQGNDSIKVVWEYECSIEDLDPERIKGVPMPTNLAGPPGAMMAQTRGGGAVMELSDRSMFVSMSGPYGKIFIVGRDKKIIWSALPEKWDIEKQEWKTISQYRGSIITDRKKLEQLIWSSERQ